MTTFRQPVTIDNLVKHGVAVCRLTHENLTDEDTSQTITVPTLNTGTGESAVPANSRIMYSWINVITAFAGGGHLFAFRDSGAMLFFGVPTSEGEKALEDAKKALAAELTNIAKKGVSAKELEKAINMKLMESVSTLATNSGRANAIAQGALWYGDPKRMLSDLDRYAAVKPADIKRVAEQYLNGNWVFYELVPAAGGASLTGMPK